MRFALVCLFALTRAVDASPAAAITAQDLIDVAIGDRQPDEFTASMPLQDRIDAIHQLIRAGGSCKASDVCTSDGDYEPPAKKSTSKSPCFRRWELYTLLYDFPLDEMLHLNAGEMHAVTKLDDSLIDFIGRDLESDQQIELAHLLKDKKREIPFPLTLDNRQALKAVKKYQLDEAVSSLDPGNSEAERKALLRVVLDSGYRAATRSDAINRLAEASDSSDPFFSMIIPLMSDPSIEVAATVAYRTGAEMRRPATTNTGVFMRALAILVQANMGQPDYALTYAPHGLDIFAPSGVLLLHYDGADAITTELSWRIHSQPPVFGTDKRGDLILRGFVETPEASEAVDGCAARAGADDSGYSM